MGHSAQPSGSDREEGDRMTLPLADIQGHVYPGFKKPNQAYLFVQFIRPCGPEAPADSVAPDNLGWCIVPPAAVRGWLQELIPLVSTGDDVDQDIEEFKGRRDGRREPREGDGPPRLLSVAFSSTGLNRLGADPAELARLPTDFTRSPEQRAALVRDRFADMPNWTVGGSPATEADAVVILAAESDDDLRVFLGEEERRLEAHSLHRLDAFVGAVLPGYREHFGYKDNVTRITPVMTDAPDNPEVEVPAGELMLGLPRYERVDESGAHVDPPDHPSWAEHGSYLVFRKLEQRVHEFRTATAANAAQLVARNVPNFPADPAEGEALLRAACIGRWPDGTPLAASPGHPPAVTPDPLPAVNAQTYRDDPHGLDTPRFAHIRKVHPRDFESVRNGNVVDRARNHRLLRRGITYGPVLPPGDPDGEERGVLFAAYQASISEQFEFIMQAWANRARFSTLDSDVPVSVESPGQDVVVGVNTSGDGTSPRQAFYPRETFVGGDNLEHLAEEPITFEKFVLMRGGGYFLAPTKPNLQVLANG
jgi:Dyp-type peroxidase family